MLVYQRVKHVDTCVFDGFWRMSLSLDLVEIVLLRRWCKQIGGWSGLFICFIGKGNGKGETSMQGNGGLADEFCWLGNWSFESGVDMDVNGPKVYRNTGISYGWDWFQLYSIYSLVPFFGSQWVLGWYFEFRYHQILSVVPLQWPGWRWGRDVSRSGSFAETVYGAAGGGSP